MDIPLTLKELEKMNDMPVWVELIDCKICRNSILKRYNKSGWYIISTNSNFSCNNAPYALKVNPERFFEDNLEIMLEEGCFYGETWIAYLNKPKNK